jgi:AcrR family transcriptional regulator
LNARYLVARGWAKVPPARNDEISDMSADKTNKKPKAPVRKAAPRRGRASAKRVGWQRDPEGMRKRILEAATAEFANYGLSGARIDRIARVAGANKRMLYYHVGNKDDLYLEVLVGSYESIRAAERELNLEALAPIDALVRLLEFTWLYYLDHPEFLALLSTENLHRGAFLRRSRRIKDLHSPFVGMIRAILRRGEADGTLRKGIDPVQLYISIASLCWFYVSNSHTLTVIFGADMLDSAAKSARLDHIKELFRAALEPRDGALDPGVAKLLEFNQ